MSTTADASAGPATGTILCPDWLLTDANTEPEAGHAVRVVGGVVDAVGPRGTLTANHPDDEVIDLPDRIVLPGFVNAHVHMLSLIHI